MGGVLGAGARPREHECDQHERNDLHRNPSSHEFRCRILSDRMVGPKLPIRVKIPVTIDVSEDVTWSLGVPIVIVQTGNLVVRLVIRPIKSNVPGISTPAPSP